MGRNQGTDRSEAGRQLAAGWGGGIWGGGRGQLAFRACMLMIRAALEGLLDFTKASAFGRPGWMATRPAASKASSMVWTRGQREDFWGGVRASARRRPPGAEVSQM